MDVYDVNPSAIQTTPDDSVAVGRCHGGGHSYVNQGKTISRDGTISGTIPRSAGQYHGYNTCLGEFGGTVDADGTVYGSSYTGVSRETTWFANRNGTMLWDKRLTTTSSCWGSQKIVRLDPIEQEVHGEYIFGLAELDDYGSCNDERFLVKINKLTGDTTSWSLGPGWIDYFGVYADGVVVFQDDSAKLRYFSFDGHLQATHTLPYKNPKYSAYPSAHNMAGRVIFRVAQWQDRPADCGYNNPTGKLLAYAPSGKLFEQDNGCVSVTSVAINHLDIIAATTVGTESNSTVGRLVKFSSSGEVMQNTVLPKTSAGYTYDYSTGLYVFADTNGNFLRTSWFSYSPSQRDGAVYSLTGPTSNVELARFSSDALPVLFPRPMRSNIGMIGMTSGVLYVAATYHDNSGEREGLFSIPFAELGMDYPRGALLGVGPVAATKQYAALGDSYSSGEGVEPFYIATDTAGPPENRCHRSTKAYPRLLDLNRAIGLSLTAFRACSGATTQNVLNGGQWNEPSQVSSLTTETDVVTISIGGNDIGFESFARNCLKLGCAVGSGPYLEASLKINDISMDGLEHKLLMTYAEIRERAPHADVYVLGYPYVVPNDEGRFGQGDTPGRCSFSWNGIPAGSISPESREGATSILSQLNSKIQETVDRFGPKFHFVSPHQSFVTHELCDLATGSDYFNPPQLPEAYSLHPNSLGQAAYAGAVKDALVE
ncbi:SGNH/GDSL hydrolase family protein [Actinokineospora guangxiensis]|uniref:SGNH/GDSL hydrolase family protein n=1 Tax=Actinokineospora guangxiensis TaxID=1490288 RepID=A0ABW0EXT4_9PSEU